MATSVPEASSYTMVPSDLVPVFKNHASMPLLGTGESLKEVVTNYKYSNPYECRVNSGNPPVDTSDDYYIPEIGLPGSCWWYIKYFPFDSSGKGSQFAIPLDNSQSPLYRGSTADGWTGWLSLSGSSTRSTKFVINPSDWASNTDVADYGYRATITDTNIISSMDASVTIAVTDMGTAQSAQLAPSGTTFDGGIYVYAKSIPTAAISGTYVLFNT